MALIKRCPYQSRVTSFVQSSFRGNISSDELQFRPEMLADIYYSGWSAIAVESEKRALGGCRQHRPREDAQDQTIIYHYLQMRLLGDDETHHRAPCCSGIYIYLCACICVAMQTDGLHLIREG